MILTYLLLTRIVLVVIILYQIGIGEYGIGWNRYGIESVPRSDARFSARLSAWLERLGSGAIVMSKSSVSRIAHHVMVKCWKRTSFTNCNGHFISCVVVESMMSRNKILNVILRICYSLRCESFKIPDGRNWCISNKGSNKFRSDGGGLQRITAVNTVESSWNDFISLDLTAVFS